MNSVELVKDSQNWGLVDDIQVAFLQVLAQLVGARTILEVGVALGDSALGLCQAAKANGGKYYGVDYWSLMESAPIKQISYSDMATVGARLEKFGFTDFTLKEIDTFSPDFEEFLKTIAPIDFVFIDANHSYAGVSNDLYKCLKYMSAQSVIVLHDTKSCDGPRRLMLELKESLKGYEILDLTYSENNIAGAMGLGVIKKNSKSQYGVIYNLSPTNESELSQIFEQEKAQETVL